MRGVVRRLAAAGALAAGGLAAGCLEPLDPGSQAIAAVRVTIGEGSAAADTIQVRATTRVRAAAIGREGYELPVTGFTFASSDTSVAVVDEGGTVRGVAPGEATITATAPRGGESGSVRVVVVPSTIAYTIRVGLGAGAIAFSSDYTRAYVATDPDSVVVVDALGFFRIDAVRVGARAAALAATASRLFATHPFADSVSVVLTARNAVDGRRFLGAGPTGVVATGERVTVAARFDERLVVAEGTLPVVGIPVGGEPHALALSRDGTRLYATVRRADGWYVVAVNPAYPDTVGSVRLAGEPTAIATNGDGSRVYVLLASARTVAVYAVAGEGQFALAGTVATGERPGGIAARQTGPAYVVVSGAPAIVFDGVSLAVTDRIDGAGEGPVAIRPDGLFAFVSDPAAGRVNVLGL